MPVRRTERTQDRAAPYHVRRSNMAAAVISPQPWQGLHSSHTPSLSWQPQMHPYSQPTLIDYSQSLNGPNLTSLHHAIPSQDCRSSVNRISQPPQHQPQPPPQQQQQQHPSHQTLQQQPQTQAQQTQQQNSQDGGPWTAEMDNTLMEAQARGMRWEQISQVYFPHKSANACRKRFGRAKEERRATDWDEARIGRVIAIYNREAFRERLWSQLANEAGERWQDIEKLCFSQGLSRMVRGRGNHSRNRSRASRDHGLDDGYDHQRYPSHEDYDSRDDSGIGLGLMTDHNHQVPSTTQVISPPITSGAPIEMLIQQPSHGYSYAS